jgi:BNR repeat-like domain
MTEFRMYLFGAALTVLLVVTCAITGADSSSTAGAPLDRGRFVMPFGLSVDNGQRVLSFEDEAGDDEEGLSGQSANSITPFAQPDPEKAWLLDAGTFSQLSSAGQRAALRMNGLLRARHRNQQSGFPSSDVTAEANPGDNIRVNNPALDTTFHTHSETSIAVNGVNLALSFNEGLFGGCGISTDGGNNWAHKRIPDPPGGANLGDGVVAFGPSGELYYATLAVVTSGGGSKSFVGVSKSTDNGATFSTPFDASTTAGNTSDFQDKEWVAVDRNPSSLQKGNVYVTWTDFLSPSSNGSFISFARSTNGGASFGAPVAVSPQDRTQSVQGSVPVVAPNGDLYVAFSDGHSAISGIGIVKSTDGGVTFSAETRVAAVTNVNTMTGGGGVRSNSFPSMTVDKNGAVHVVYDAWTRSLVDRSDIFYVRSNDGGSTFSSPLKLNDDGSTTTQFLPSIAAASDGTLGVKWWDRRNDLLNDGLTDVYMTISHDGGVSFGKNFRVTNQNWFFGPIEPGFAGGYHGDYDGITADANNFYTSWSDERNSEPDAFFSQIPTTRDPNTPDFNISPAKLFDDVIAGNSTSFDLRTSGANGFSGTLSLSASPAVSGLTYSFANASINSGDPSSLMISTSSAVPPGPYTITVAASGSGLTRKTNLRLTVLSASRSSGAPVNASHTKGFTSMQGGLKVDAAGTINLVFDDDSARVRSNDALYTRSTDGGKTFSTPITVSGNSLIATQSTLALDSAGNPYVGWFGLNPLPSQGTFAIFFSRSTDHGNSFSTPVVASGASRNAQNPEIVVDKNGNVVIAYIDFLTSGSPIFSVRSTDGGVTFSAPSRVSQPGEIIGNPPFVAADSTGAAYVIYQDSSQSTATIKLAVATDGQTFAASKVVSNSQVNAFAPQIAIDKNDGVYVTFYDRFAITSSTFNREIILIKSTDKGNTFGPDFNVSEDSGQSTFPSLIVGDQGRVSIAWEDTTDDLQRDVLVARSTDGGTTFGTPINLSADNGRSFGGFGGTDNNGNLFIGWTDDSGANTDVFVSSLSSSALGPPDFTIGTGSATPIVNRGTRVNLTVNINRFAGFSGNVTLTPPDLAGLKAKGVSFDTTSTGGTLSFKLKGGGVTGPQFITFTGRDDTGRTRVCILDLLIQPAQ